MNATPGRVVILNGAPRAGKSSIARELQRDSSADWLVMGVDHFMSALPRQLQPGFGLRPDRHRPASQAKVEQAVPGLLRAAYASIAAHALEGFNIVADFGHHDAYSQSFGLLRQCAASLRGLDAWLVAVDCPLEEILRRRRATGFDPPDAPDNPWARAWQIEVHSHAIYDLRLDTSLLPPVECAARILRLVSSGEPTAFARLASGDAPSPPNGPAG